MLLDKTTFLSVIDNTPLVSIDLIVVNELRQALLGERLNRPAQGSWFVPGGRIFKNESLESAFIRLSNEELGLSCKIEEAKLLGPYDHFYDDSMFSEQISTHYVAIAYILKVNSSQVNNLPSNDQHFSFRWFDIRTISSQSRVHKHTISYFDTIIENGILM